MSMLIPPQMINTMEEHDLRDDRVRRYMAPAFSDRQTEWTSHPMSSRDSLHEADMWAVEGLTHRYPTKVLAELIPTCPQYCGHCTRMDLVGNDTLQVLKYKFEVKQNDRWDQMLDYLRKTPQVRDVVVSGGDMANVPIKRLEDFVSELLDIENIRDIRLASKGLMGLPQHFLQDDVRAGLEAMATKARSRGVDIALHTHVNCAQQVTPLVGKAGADDARRRLPRRAQPGRAAAGREHRAERPAGAVLHAPRSREDHAVLLLHVRHDPQRRALADVRRRGAGPAARHHGLPAGLRHAARRLRRAVRRQALGPHAEGLRPRSRASRTGRRTTGPASRTTIPRRSRAVPVLRPDLHAARKRGSSGGGSRRRTANRSRFPPDPSERSRPH